MNVNQWEHQLADGLPNTIQIHFQIENPTPIPLHLDMILCKACQSLSFRACTFLVPDNPFPHQFNIRLSTEQMALYGNAQEGLVLSVEISVFFTDAFNNQWNQIFERMMVCRRVDNYLYVRESQTRMRRSSPNDPHED